MRLVHLTAPGRIELNYLWMPTWLGINQEVKEAVEKELSSAVGRPASEETLDEFNERVLEVLTERYPNILGLRDYLDGLKFVQI